MHSTNAADPNYHQQQQNHQQWWPQQYQQQWMGMQYPATAMTMPYAQQYMPYHQQSLALQQQQHAQVQGSTEENKSVWVGELQTWMDETYLQNCFSHSGEVASVKVIRNKQTGQSEGYGFIEFYSHSAAEKVLQTYNGTLMPNTDQTFRLNWATSNSGDKRSDSGSDLSIFVGDLAGDVTDTLLHETFASRYSSVKGAKVVTDPNTGRSKGYGFVRFADDNERTRAMSEMNGMYCSTRPMRIGVATPKKFSSQAGGNPSNAALSQGSQFEIDSTNTTIFVGGLDPTVTDEDLRHHFSQCGEVISVKIPVGKGCGFVQFANRNNAEGAIQSLNGTIIGKQTVRLSWGRNQGNKQVRGENNQWNGAYNGGQGYDGYGYAVPQTQASNMYNTASAAAPY